MLGSSLSAPVHKGEVVATQLVKTRVGDETIWVEATVLPGSQPTASPDRNAQKVLDAFSAARRVIVDLATEVAATGQELADRAVRPDEIAVEFGLKIATEGSIILVSGSAEASLTVKLTYKGTPDEQAGS